MAIDSAGNTSPEAKVTIQIDKPDTKVDYADLDGSPAHKAALRLAEEGIFVGEYRNGQYFFDPDQTVSRAEFLSLAMATAGLEPMEDVTVTGFSDDEAIPTWAKGCISSALSAGVIQGSRDGSGAPVFGAEEAITQGEATVMLNNLLDVADVPLEVFASEGDRSPLGQPGRRQPGRLRRAAGGGDQLRRPGRYPHPGRRGRAAGRRPGRAGRPGGRRLAPLVSKKHPPDCSGGCSFFRLNAPVQGLAQADLARQGLVQQLQELLLVLRQAALQRQVVGGVVTGEVQRVHVQVLNEQMALL